MLRMVIESLTFYPGAPVNKGVLGANVVIMGFLSEDKELFNFTLPKWWLQKIIDPLMVPAAVLQPLVPGFWNCRIYAGNMRTRNLWDCECGCWSLSVGYGDWESGVDSWLYHSDNYVFSE